MLGATVTLGRSLRDQPRAGVSFSRMAPVAVGGYRGGRRPQEVVRERARRICSTSCRFATQVGADPKLGHPRRAAILGGIDASLFVRRFCMEKWLQTASLPISLVAFALAAWLYWAATTHERRLIEEYQPGLVQLYNNLGIEVPPEPQTLDEFLESCFKPVEDTTYSG
jgi:hypothetical protein